jgi:6,7-dimethyl-8-ribityllumazine synthase
MAKNKSSVAKRGKPSAKAGVKSDKLRMLIVESRFYNDIADALLLGATYVLDQAGAHYERITVPGALEIPTAIAMAVDAARTPYDGIVALGCVIQGETYHFEIVADQSAHALMDLAVSQKLAIGNGILTVDTQAQANARASADADTGYKSNKGAAAARAALAMAALKRKLEN